MFLTKKPVFAPTARVLDSPMRMIIDPKYLATNTSDGKLLILRGNFQNITDSGAYQLLRDKLDKLETV